MAKELSVLVNTSNDLRGMIKSFNNTFLTQFVSLQGELLTVYQELLNAGYSGIDDAIADISNHGLDPEAGRGLTIKTNLLKTKELYLVLNNADFSEGVNLADKLVSIKDIINKVSSITVDLHRV